MMLSACQRFNLPIPTGWTLEPIGKRISLEYGSGLTDAERMPGAYQVFGSNGPVGTHDKHLVEGPGVLVGRKGSVGEVHFSEGHFWPIDTVYYVTRKANDDLRYIACLLEFLRLGNLNAATGVPGLTRRDALFMLGAFPREDEQTRIAETLKASDDHIRAIEEQIRKAERVKKSLLQAFPPSPKHGTGTPLHRVADITSGFTKGRDLAGHDTVEIPYLTVVNVLEGRVDISDLSSADVKLHEVEHYGLRDGDILMTEGGDRDKVGRGSIWLGQIPRVVCQNHIFRVRLNTDEVLPWFMHYLLQTYSARRYFTTRAKQSSNLCSINSREMRLFELPTLTTKAQEPWVERLRAADVVIAAVENQLTAARRVKQSLLQNLLTGKIRLKD